MITVFSFDKKELIPDDIFTSSLKFRIEKDEIKVSYIPDNTPDYGRDDYITECSIKIEPYSRFIIVKDANDNLFEIDGSYHTCSFVDFYKEGFSGSQVSTYKLYENKHGLRFVAEILIASVTNDEIELVVTSLCSLQEDIHIEDVYYNSSINYVLETEIHRRKLQQFKRGFYDFYKLKINDVLYDVNKKVVVEDDEEYAEQIKENLSVFSNIDDYILVEIQKFTSGNIPRTRDGDNDILYVVCDEQNINDEVSVLCDKLDMNKNLKRIGEVQLKNGVGSFKYYPEGYTGNLTIILERLPKKHNHVYKYNFLIV